MTTQRRLTIDDLVHGLDTAPAAYHALDVFADDVEEAQTRKSIPGLRPLDSTGLRYALERGSKTYELQAFPTEGVLRLSRPAPQNASQAAVTGALFGAALGSVAAARGKKGEAAALGALLGLLVGGPLFGGADAPRRVFTMKFDRATGEWQAYDGGLVRWMKRELLPRPA